jgi:dTDP-4-dehydrorhamnose reductase
VTLAALVVGGFGQLGRDLIDVVSRDPDFAFGTALGHGDLDIGDGDAVAQTLADWSRLVRSDGDHRVVVFNCAAYTDVDGAESDEAAAHLSNAVGPAQLATACAEHDVDLVHVSTDYVFAGDGDLPYEVNDPTAPRTAYGRSKLAGEQAVLRTAPRSYVVRTAWVYGANGSNFVKTIARLERSHETVTVVDDQRGSPTWSRDVATGLVALAKTGRYGVYHCTNSGDTTWCGFARAVFEELGADPARVRPCTTADYPRPAPRPSYSVLGDASWRAAGLAPLRPWREALSAAFAADGDALRGVR